MNDARVDPKEQKSAEAKVRTQAMKTGSFANWGPPNAPITLVIFSDFECPYCRKAANVIKQIIGANDSDVEVVFRNFPLPMHPWAQVAAESAECVRLQKNANFWAMHDFIFDNQDQLRADSIRTQLDQRVKTLAGLDFPAYATCMDNHSSLELIHRDLSIGEIAGVDATPTIFVNGYRLSGSSREQLLTLYPTA